MIAFIYWSGFFVALVLLAMVTGGHIARSPVPYTTGEFVGALVSIILLSLLSWITVINLFRNASRIS